ncbi:Peptidyl-prolyl cis-trans isomerase [hydrothermal vent metagenome]|uniref:peptidylprolyl isomerase n=1 Tax=hydrothermal vent metagenome TaxID=652676 RepID=A0A1W1CLU9_9ZZZZ
MKKILLTVVAMLFMVFTGCNAKDSNVTVPKVEKSDKKQEGTLVTLKTNQGDIVLKMFPKVAPLAVENFVTHVKDGYYNGLIFHRVIKDFMIQGGDPTGTGRGGESIWKKEFVNEYAPNVVFDRPFLLAMANHGPNTNGSQFFITTKATPFLNGGYTIFGEVVSGQDVVRKIENTKTGMADRPINEQKIVKATVKN